MNVGERIKMREYTKHVDLGSRQKSDQKNGLKLIESLNKKRFNDYN